MLNCRCETWKRKYTKFDHYNFTGLTEKKIQSSFHSVLDCFQLLYTEFSNIAAEITLTIYTIVHEKHEQNVMITYGKLQTIVITSDLKQEMQDISVQHYM